MIENIDTNQKNSIDYINTECWQKRYEKPREVYSEASKIIHKCEEINYKKGLYYSKLNKIVCLFLMSEHNDQILKELYEIVDYFSQNDNEIGYVNSLNVTANVLQSYGDFKTALDFCIKAQKKAQILKLEADLADNFSICGLIYSDLFDFETAISNFKQALEIRTKINSETAMASSLNLIARNYALSANYSEALIYYNKALELRKKINDTGGLPWTHIGLASTYEKMNDYVTALNHYEIALNLNKEIGDKRCKLHCYFGIGSIKSVISPSKIAEEYLLDAKKIADELNARPLVYQIFKNLSELYERMLDIPKAFAYFKMYQTNKEEVVNAKLQNQLKNKEIVFAIEKSQREAEIYRLKHVELKSMYGQLQQKNREITDSINYARNIQMALLPSGDYIDQMLPERFILFKPRNIVSGDFYWINKVNDNFIIVAADCTGHGVPGAFMSLLGISFLNEIVNNLKIIKPDLVLNKLREMVISALNKNKNNKEISDGMDISLCLINENSLEMQYAGAFNPLFVFRKIKQNTDIELIQIDGDRMPIGLYIKDNEPFLNKTFKLQKSDTIYMFSDGYPDQFGGPLQKKQKFMKKRFKQLLFEIQFEDMNTQKQILENKLVEWMKDENTQTDDITVIGLRF
ncbi:MAG: tetratricopeptide repeat protein [Bacteroidales bacterium]|nr:tetratricopeptide repeat protein [Bacteroidales bacterium]